MIYIILGLTIIILVLGGLVFNLLKKLEKAEDILYSYLEYLNKISKVIELSDKKMKEIDYKGSFSSDDEIGFAFKQIKEIQDILNEFTLK
jgi:hypothetical protein